MKEGAQRAPFVNFGLIFAYGFWFSSVPML